MRSSNLHLQPTVCGHCGAALLAPELFNRSEPAACPHCGVLRQTLVFPAFFRAASSGPKPEGALVAGESSCFYHPQKRAVVPCGQCGRFLCALCDVDFDGQHLCPACLERSHLERTLPSLENRRVRYDRIVLLLALVPILVWPFTLITAPATLYLAVRYWNSPGSVVGSSKIAFVIAVLVALAEIAAWTVGLYYVFTR